MAEPTTWVTVVDDLVKYGFPSVSAVAVAWLGAKWARKREIEKEERERKNKQIADIWQFIERYFNKTIEIEKWLGVVLLVRGVSGIDVNEDDEKSFFKDFHNLRHDLEDIDTEKAKIEMLVWTLKSDKCSTAFDEFLEEIGNFSSYCFTPIRCERKDTEGFIRRIRDKRNKWYELARNIISE